MQFILRHERRHELRFAPLDGETARAIRARHPATTGVDSMIWVEAAGTHAERTWTRSAAALRAARYMGGAWRFAALGALVPRPLRDAAYDVVARHRHRLFSDPAQCFAPPPSVRSRFLDAPPGERP